MTDLINAVHHRGYMLRPAPKRLAGGGWNHEGFIIVENGPNRDETKFSIEGSSETHNEAADRIVEAMRQQIDEWLA